MVIEELGSRWDGESVLYFIQHKLDELTLNQNKKSTWLILSIRFTNRIIVWRKIYMKYRILRQSTKKSSIMKIHLQVLYKEKRSQEFLMNLRFVFNVKRNSL